MKKTYLFLAFLFLSIYNYGQTFTEQTGIYLSAVEGSSVDWGDYNNDGYLDILLTGNNGSSPVTKIYKNNGDGTFSLQTTISLTGVYNSSVAWGDYNNDGYLDILLTGQTILGGSGSNCVSKIYKNNKDGTFTEQTAISLTGVQVGSVAWGDYNNDGYLDILLTGYMNNYLPSVIISKIYKNNGDGTFTEQTGINLAGVYNSSVAWGDYNNDGYLDILLTGNTGSSNVSKIYKNNGDGNFTEQTGINLTGVSNGKVAWGDYNNDGYLDIILTGNTGSSNVSKIYKNNGDGTFTEQTSISLTGIEYSSVAWGDYNNDGFLDILLTGYTGSSNISKIYKNNGDGAFTEQSGISLTGVEYSSVAWGDYNNDGYLDILLTGLGSSFISKIYKNTFTVSNNSPTIPSNLQYNSNSKILSWNRSTDDHTPSSTISYNLAIGTSNNPNKIKSAQSDLNTGFRGIVTMGNQQLDSFSIINNISYNFDSTYYARVQAIDNGYKGSGFTTPIQLPIAPPFGNIINNNTTINCGYSTQLDISVLNGNSSSLSYLWTPSPELSNANIRNPIVKPFHTTWYKVIATSQYGLSFIDSTQITVNPMTVNAGIDVTKICGDSVLLNPTTNYTGNATNLTWSWSPSIGLNNTTLKTPKAKPILTTNYVVNLNSTDGCTAIDTIIYNVNPMTVDAGIDTSLACGSYYTLTPLINNYPVSQSNLNYHWSPSNSLDDSLKKNPKARPFTTTTFYLNLNSTEGCQATDSVKLTLKPLVINANNITRTCGDSTNFGASVNSNSTTINYIWTPSYGLSNPNLLNTYVTPNYTTTYIIKATDSVCMATDTVKVTVNTANFNLSYIANQTLFVNPPFIVQLNNNTPNMSNYNFLWKFGDGTTLSSNNASVFHQYTYNGLYSVSLIATQITNLCHDTLVKSGYIYCSGGVSACGYTANILQNSPIIACQGDSVYLSCNTDTSFTYQWLLNGIPIQGAINSYIYVHQGGNYSVTIYRLSNSCANTSSVVIVNINASPVSAGIISGLTTVCQNQNNVTYSVPIIANATSYNWTLPNGASGNSSTQSIVVNYGTTAVNGSITVFGSNSCGNGATSTLPIIVNPLPVASGIITGPINVCPGQNYVTYSVAAIDNATSYLWTLPNGASGTSSADNITVNYGASASLGNITVRGNNSCGDGALSTLTITIKPSYNILVNHSICQGYSVVVGTHVYNTTGTYIDSLTTYQGCDSIITTNLIVKPISNSQVNRTICQGESIIVGLHSYSITGTYIDTLTTFLGCDSIITTSLVVNPTCNFLVNRNICQGELINVGVQTYNITGTYIDTLTTILGCDSIITTNLIVNPNYNILNYRSICQGDSIIVGIHSYNITGTYIDSLTTSLGCDSIVTTNLTANPKYNIQVNHTICQGDSIIVGVHSYNTTGNYIDYLTTSYGCDSVITTNLIVNPFPSNAGTITGASIVCQGENVVSYMVPPIDNATSYIWTLANGMTGNSDTNSLLVNYDISFVSGLISVKGTNSCGIGLPSSLLVNKHIPDTIPICYVEYDTLTQKNKIYWSSLISNSTDSINIYRELSLNNWNKTGSTLYSNHNFIDLTSIPSSQSYNYKISGIDTCDNESAMSSNHKTITLITSYNQLSNTYGFSWSGYEGIAVSQYNIYGVEANGNATIIGTVPGNSLMYNYMNPNPIYINYFVGFDVTVCGSGKSLHTVKSNYVSSVTGIIENKTTYFNIYPNPAKEILIIETNSNTEQRLEIINLIGQTVYTSNINKKATINTSAFANGVYILKLSSDKETIVRKFVKE